MNVTEITSSAAVVSWQLPFSLIEITNYSLTVYELPSIGLTIDDPRNFTIVNSTTMELMLRPNRQYNVTVVAYNRAGRGEEAMSGNFTTMEDGEFVARETERGREGIRR